MAYKVPEDELVKKAIGEVLLEHREVDSQDSFHALVKKKLRLGDKKYRVSETRIRRIAAVMGSVGIRVVKMKSKHQVKRCYVCGGELVAVNSVDLFGGKTMLGKKCKTCGFEIGKENLVPRRYIFYGK